MGVELIHDEREAIGIAIAPIEQIADNMRPRDAAAVRRRRDMAPAGERLAGEEQAGHPLRT